jgi:tetratricopeptide (TPR) repeat protein
MAAFEKAVTLAPVPMTWNNIAYALAQQDIQLDRAEKYSDTAINAVETQMRDVKLDNLRMQDLATSNFLFNAWDTKGWIEFKQGKVDDAEQYIQSAFLAAGRGDEAEHLGEIYEKRGQRDDAIRYYLFSLISEAPAADGRAKLDALGVKNVDSRLPDASKELGKLRTVPLKQSGKGNAEFFLLMSPGKVEQVKFIKGDDEVKNLADSLQKSDLTMKFPPDVQAQVVRRVIVQCGTTAVGPCSVEFIPSSQVRSLE